MSDAKEPKLSPHPCRWCGGPVKRPRRTWCSEECVMEFTRRYHQASFRLFVWNRSDKRCNRCGINLEAYEALLRSVQSGERTKLRAALGFSDHHSWEADHIVPQQFGGDELDPKLNGQVLCERCHHEKTKLDCAAIREAAKQPTTEAK